MNIGNYVSELIKKPIEDAGLILDKCEYVTEDNINYLRVVIDKVGGPTLDDCVKVNEIINPIIDDLDYLQESYMLDVCTKENGSE